MQCNCHVRAFDDLIFSTEKSKPSHLRELRSEFSHSLGREPTLLVTANAATTPALESSAVMAILGARRAEAFDVHVDLIRSEPSNPASESVSQPVGTTSPSRRPIRLVGVRPLRQELSTRVRGARRA
jgi:hypothetical protein